MPASLAIGWRLYTFYFSTGAVVCLWSPAVGGIFEEAGGVPDLDPVKGKRIPMFFRKKEKKASAIVHMDDRDFDESLAALPGVAVVDFWAPWCAPCRMMEPILEDVARDFRERGVTVVKVNTDEAPMTAERFGVRSIPTLVFFREGEPLFEVVGLAPQPALVRELESLLRDGGGSVDGEEE